jgi:hypothetical protein
MEKKDLIGYGTSRQMIYRYLKPDGPKPPEEFLRAAAEILDPVRYEWLATGDGEMEKPRETARVVYSTLSAIASASATVSIPADSPFQPPNGLADAMEPAFSMVAEVMEPIFDALHVSKGAKPAWVGGVVSVWRELTESGLDGMGDEYKRISKALRAPIDAFDVKLEEMPDDVLSAYVFGVIPGLLALAREARDQRNEADELEGESND